MKRELDQTARLLMKGRAIMTKGQQPPREVPSSPSLERAYLLTKALEARITNSGSLWVSAEEQAALRRLLQLAERQLYGR